MFGHHNRFVGPNPDVRTLNLFNFIYDWASAIPEYNVRQMHLDKDIVQPEARIKRLPEKTDTLRDREQAYKEAAGQMVP